MEIIDISNPANPRWVGGGDGRVLGYVAFGRSHAYAADGTRFQVIDLSDPANPPRVGQCELRHGGYRLAVSDKYACRIDQGSGWLEVIDISDPAHPQSVGESTVTGSVNGVAMSGTKVYVATSDGLTVLDISDPANPQRIAALTGFSGYTLAVSSNLLVVSAAWSTATESFDGLRLFDVTDPASPQPLAILHTGRFTTFEIALSGNYAYTVDGRGFHVADLSDPRIPKRVGGYAIGQIMASALSGNHAYVAEGWAGLQVLDISDPARPSRAGGYAGGRFAQDVAVNGHHAYVLSADETWWNSGFQLNVINVEDPSNPRWVGDLTFFGPVGIPRLAVSGRYAYVACFSGATCM